MPRDIKLWNAGRELLWYLSFLIAIAAIINRVTVQFARIGNPVSVTKFLSFNILMCVVALLMTFLWWRGSSTELEFLAPVRRLIQERCVVFGPIFIGVSFLLSAFLYAQCNTIDSLNQQKVYSLSCIFVFPWLYGMLMYLRPPKHISKVIAPGYGIFNAIIRFALALGFGAFAYWQFAINFL